MIVDYHMHLRDPEEQVDHSVAAIERFVETASERGVDEIGFTEHIYYFEQTRPFWTEPYMLEYCVNDLDAYIDAVVAAKDRGLPVKLGLEVDYFPGTEPGLAELLARYPFDYLLGSVHFVDGFPVDSEPGLVDKLGPAEAWRRYFVWLRNAARSGLFDSLAHPDLAKHHGPRPDAEAVQWLHEETADAIEAAGVCVEVSAAGLRKPVGEVYPDAELLEACRERGVPITVASDAHAPQEVGLNLDRAIEHARAAGYETLTVFEGRQRRQEPLG
ncbi:MAG: histidinol-phosphatase HisJ family protein [Actinomycetota bacterium]|nr:histidinol-phosphatase HisJ family protein [Actinomycetota bacterium]